MPRLLASINHITMFRGELNPEIYFVVLQRKADARPNSDALQAVALGEDISGWFSLEVTPQFKLRKRENHTFIGGLPIFEGDPGEKSTVYLAVVDSDRGARHIGGVLSDLFTKKRGDESALSLVKQVARLIKQGDMTTSMAKTALSLLIKGVEVALINNRDDIQYTNVFTFKTSNDYLAGKTPFSNQRVRGELEVEVLEQ
jgi:hypothetical protein